MVDKIQLIKDYRQKYSVGLYEAKSIIESFISIEVERALANKSRLHSQWEYRTLDAAIGYLSFKEFGDEGWQLCASYNHRFYFKRRK